MEGTYADIVFDPPFSLLSANNSNKERDWLANISGGTRPVPDKLREAQTIRAAIPKHMHLHASKQTAPLPPPNRPLTWAHVASLALSLVHKSGFAAQFAATAGNNNNETYYIWGVDYIQQEKAFVVVFRNCPK